MRLKGICVVATILYFLLCFGHLLPVKDSLTSRSTPSTNATIRKRVDNKTDELIDNNLYEYNKTLPGALNMIAIVDSEQKKYLEDKTRNPLFISREESNNFLSRNKREVEVVKLPNTGPTRFNDLKTPLYQNFKYAYPPRTKWWPTYKSEALFDNCFFRQKKRFEGLISPRSRDYCRDFEEVYEYYKGGFDKGLTYELASMVWRFIQCERGPEEVAITVNCPKPCLSNPCSKPHMTKCVQTGTRGSTDYQCGCETGWRWNKATKNCDDIKICGTSKEECVTANIVRCVDRPGLEYICECKVPYMGDHCEQDYNACIDFNNPCGVNGRCIPYIGQQSWSCDCEPGWGDDPNHTGRDCNKRDNPCENLNCRNGGECKASAALTAAYCICQDLYRGETCEERIPQWNEWMSWNDCSVTCGTGGMKTRERTCDTIGASYCGGGQSREEEACSGPICLVNGEWGPWTKMTDCSHNCDGGKYLRARNCEYANSDPDTFGDPCKGDLLSYEDCNVMTCPSTVKRKMMVDIESLARSILAETGIAEGDWGAWNSWTSCSETCGEGFRQRGRSCLNSLGTCEGQSEEFKDCYDNDCETENEYLPWSSWSVWSMCTPGIDTCTRTRHCPYGLQGPEAAEACPGEGMDEAPCRYSTCTGESPADLVDVANIMGGNVARDVQVGNLYGAQLPPNSYLNAAVPGYVAPVAIAPVAGGYPNSAAGGHPNNMNGIPPPPSAQPPIKKEDTISFAGVLFGVLIFAIVCCFIRKKRGKKRKASGYQTKSRVGREESAFQEQY